MDKNKKVLFEYASKLLKMFDKMYDKENAFKILNNKSSFVIYPFMLKNQADESCPHFNG